MSTWWTSESVKTCRAFDGRGAGDADGDVGGWLQPARGCSLPWSQSLAAMGLAAHTSSRPVMSGCLNLMPGASSRSWPRPVLRPRRPYSSATAQIATVVLDKGPESEY
jgi:hypothetical protein